MMVVTVEMVIVIHIVVTVFVMVMKITIPAQMIALLVDVMK